MESIEKLENYRIRWMQNVDVHLMITEQCNYSCRHCLIGDKNSVVEKKLVFRIIDELHEIGNKKIIFNGGEVFTFPGFEEIVRYAHSKGFHTSCVSNGSFIDTEVAELIKQTNLEVALSIDGPSGIHNYIRNSESAFQNVENALANLKNSHVHFYGVISCIMKDNLQYIDWIVNYCIEQGVKYLRIQPVIEKGNAASSCFRDKLLSPQELLLLYDRIQEISSERVYDIDIVTIGSFLEDIMEHKCKFGLCFGDDCHQNTIPWPNGLGIRTDGSIFPFEPVFDLNDDWMIGNANNGLIACLDKYYGSPDHVRLLDTVRKFIERIPPDSPLPVGLNDLIDYMNKESLQ